MVTRWITRRLPVSLVTAATALAVATGAALAWDASSTPTEQIAIQQQQPQQGLALTGLSDVEDAGFRGTAVIAGTMSTDPETQMQEGSQAVVSLVHTGGGPASPGLGSLGHAVLLSGTCGDPVRIVRDLGPLQPLFAEGGFQPGPGLDPEVAPAWAAVGNVPAGVTPLTQGFVVVAVLDDRFNEDVLVEEQILFDEYDPELVYDDEGLFDEEVFLEESVLEPDIQNRLREFMIACGTLTTTS